MVKETIPEGAPRVTQKKANITMDRKLMEKIIAFWSYAGERALKTLAQTALATITASQVVGVLDVNWVETFSIAGLAGIMSLLTSIVVYGGAERVAAKKMELKKTK